MTESEEKLSLDKRLGTLSFNRDPEPFITVDTETCFKCEKKPCLYICPAQVYVWEEKLVYNTEGCMETGTFLMKMDQPILLTWSEGVVFFTQPIPPPEMPDDYARGDLYVASISYAPMPEYSQNVRVGNVEMGVIDLSRSPVSVELGKFLKSKLHTSS